MALFSTTPLPTLGAPVDLLQHRSLRRRASVGAAPGCTTCRRASAGELPSMPIALAIGGAIVLLIAVL
jgi:hypothetical protein